MRKHKKNKAMKKTPAASSLPRRQPVVILDFGCAFTQLIARRVREQKVFSSIFPYNTDANSIKAISPKGIILCAGPGSDYEKKPALPDKRIFKLGIPILGIGYGMPVIARCLGARVKHAPRGEYGKTEVFLDDNKDLFVQMPGNITCWMSQANLLNKLPAGFTASAHTLNSRFAAMSSRAKKIYAVQFHPEVAHTPKGSEIIANFLFKVCGCFPRWTMQSFIKEALDDIKRAVGNKKVVLGLTGGVNSCVCAILVNRAIGRNLRAIFIDNGLLRKDEAQAIKKTFRGLFHLNLSCVDASRRFLARLKGVTDPAEKRKIIKEETDRVFEEEAGKIKRVDFLAQGTLYSDALEPVSAQHKRLQLIEPLKELFKDEARELGHLLNLPEIIISRQPFPGGGLAERIVGEVTEERLRMLREADKRLIEEIKAANLYDKVWQSFAVLLAVNSAQVTSGKRPYENVAVIRCVESLDGMSADWVKLPYELLDNLAGRIIHEVKGVNRVVYDISSSPAATIEWE